MESLDYLMKGFLTWRGGLPRNPNHHGRSWNSRIIRPFYCCRQVIYDIYIVENQRGPLKNDGLEKDVSFA